MLSIKNLHVAVDDKRILQGISLAIAPGQIHAVMGPNGSGKSTLAYTLMGHPRYHVSDGSVHMNGEDLLVLPVHERAKRGLFLAFQYPLEIEGVPLKDFLRQAYNALYAGTEKQLGIKAFRDLLDQCMAMLAIKPEFAERPINVGFSGGEKKRAEMLQLAVLQPKLVILDEIDSGLDIDALKTVCAGLLTIKRLHPEMSLLIITHYQRILDYVHPDFVHVVQEGTIRLSGGQELALQLEKEGYQLQQGAR